MQALLKRHDITRSTTTPARAGVTKYAYRMFACCRPSSPVTVRMCSPSSPGHGTVAVHRRAEGASFRLGSPPRPSLRLPPCSHPLRSVVQSLVRRALSSPLSATGTSVPLCLVSFIERVVQAETGGKLALFCAHSRFAFAGDVCPLHYARPGRKRSAIPSGAVSAWTARCEGGGGVMTYFLRYFVLVRVPR